MDICFLSPVVLVFGADGRILSTMNRFFYPCVCVTLIAPQLRLYIYYPGTSCAYADSRIEDVESNSPYPPADAILNGLSRSAAIEERDGRKQAAGVMVE